MSIELRLARDNGIRYWECDWGRLINAEAEPTRGFRHLLLTTRGYFNRLLERTEPKFHWRGCEHSVTRDGNRLFMHVDYQGKRTTWELFDAHFAGEEGGRSPAGLMIGRWPD